MSAKLEKNYSKGICMKLNEKYRIQTIIIKVFE